MLLGRVFRIFSSFPLTEVSVRDSQGSPVRIYNDREGDSIISDIGVTRTDSTGLIDFWVSDDTTYTLLLISAEGAVLSRVQNVDPDVEGSGFIPTVTPEQQQALNASGTLGGITPYALWSSPEAIALRAPDGRTIPLVVNPQVMVFTVAGRSGDVVLTKADVGLNNVDNTADLDKPVSTLQAAAIAIAASQGPVASVAGRTGSVTLTKVDVGLNNVDNTADANKPVSTFQAAAIAAAAAQGPVSSVAGKVGAVTLVKGDVGLSNVDNTSDAFKPVSFAQQQAIDTAIQQALAGLPGSPVTSVAGRTGAVVLTKADVGLSNVDNTADINKPLSTPQSQAVQQAIQEAIDGLPSGGATLPSVANPNLNTFISKDSLGVCWMDRPLRYTSVGADTPGERYDVTPTSQYPGTEFAGWVRIPIYFEGVSSASGLFENFSLNIVENRFQDLVYTLRFYKSLNVKCLVYADTIISSDPFTIASFRDKLTILVQRLSGEDLYFDALEVCTNTYQVLDNNFGPDLVTQGLPALAQYQRIAFAVCRAYSPSTLICTPPFKSSESSLVETFLASSSVGVTCLGDDGSGKNAEQFLDVLTYHPYPGFDTIEEALSALNTAALENQILTYSSAIRTAISNRRLANPTWWTGRPDPAYWATEVNVSGIKDTVQNASQFRYQYFTPSQRKRLLQAVVLGSFCSGYEKVFIFSPDSVEQDEEPWDLTTFDPAELFSTGSNGNLRMTLPFVFYEGDQVIVEGGNLTGSVKADLLNISNDGFSFDLKGVPAASRPTRLIFRRWLLGGWSEYFYEVFKPFEGTTQAGFFAINSGGETLVPEYRTDYSLTRLIQGKLVKLS